MIMIVTVLHVAEDEVEVTITLTIDQMGRSES